MSSTTTLASAAPPRTAGRLLGSFLRLLPPISPCDEEWEESSPIAASRRHYIQALGSVTLVITTFGLMYTFLPVSRYSIITGLGKLVIFASGNKELGAAFVLAATSFVLFLLLATILRTRGGLKGAALREEKMFRAGAEHWNWRQRQTSNLVFGAAHLLNLFVPLAVVLGLAAGGWGVMRTYRRTYRNTRSRLESLHESAAVHFAHNQLVLMAAPVVVVAWELLKIA